MTRTVAREIAIQLSFAAQLAGEDARETADAFFSREYFATLAEEDPLFREYPDDTQLDYIRRLTGLVYDHMYELNHMIEKYARGWRLRAHLAHRCGDHALRHVRDPLYGRCAECRCDQRGCAACQGL